MRLGCSSVFVVYGHGGLDEISVSGPTLVARLQGGKVSTFTLAPEDLGLPRTDAGEVAGGDAQANARRTLDVLDGGKPGARYDMVFINAAAALVAAAAAEDLRKGVELAARSIDSGAALAPPRPAGRK